MGTAGTPVSEGQGGAPSADELFAVAIALEPSARDAYLDSRCGQDRALKTELEQLLRCHDAAGDFLEVPPLSGSVFPGLAGGAGGGGAEETPARIGRYRIERVLGVGGMGRVYLAESDHPRRLVALKVVRSGYAGASMLKRFGQETEAVARLQHPGIAQLYEAGTGDPGSGSQPYFAMEYVDGLPLTADAKARGLGLRERLELFCRVCDAVEHAHERGVVHRDLKPGNILVDASGQPKVLDFGVARLMDGGSAATTLHTHPGQLIGTLSYMSPEHVGEPGAVDARSDVYSLGVILFELLTGRLPHDFAERSIPDAVRAIREDPPTTLSTVDRVYRGDIETIVGKALEKDRSRRYQHAADLAADIRRHLHDEPIVARPASTWYELSKFAKRNKAVVGLTAAAFAALALGLVAALWQASEAAEASERAQLRETEADAARRVAVDSRHKAEENLQITQEINRFLAGLLSSPDPDERLGRNVTVMEVLDRSVRELETSFTDQPHVRAALHRTIGATYRGLSEYAKAEPHLRAAYEIHKGLYGEEHAQTLESMNQLSSLLSDRGRVDEAVVLQRRAWETSQRVLDADDTMALAIASNLSQLLLEKEQWGEAERLQRHVLERRTALLGPDDPSVLMIKNHLARTLDRSGRLPEGVALHREVVRAERASGRPMDSRSFNRMLSLANALLDMKEIDEAAALSAELRRDGEALFGNDHAAMMAADNLAAQVLMEQGRLAEAEAAFEDLLVRNRSSDVAANDGRVRILNNLGTVIQAQGRLPDAEAVFREALALLDEGEWRPSRQRLGLLNNLATSLRLQKRFGEVLPVYEEIVRTSEQLFPAGSWELSTARYGYAIVLASTGRMDEAEAQLKGAYDVLTANFPPDDPRVISVMRSFVDLYSVWGKKERAQEWRARLPERFR